MDLAKICYLSYLQIVKSCYRQSLALWGVPFLTTGATFQTTGVRKSVRRQKFLHFEFEQISLLSLNYMNSPCYLELL